FRPQDSSVPKVDRPRKAARCSTGVGGRMMATHTDARELSGPVNLGLETRVEFRQAAVDLMDTMTEPGGRLIIDLTGTRSVDSAGLGVLMLIQRHAAERRVTVILKQP